MKNQANKLPSYQHTLVKAAILGKLNINQESRKRHLQLQQKAAHAGTFMHEMFMKCQAGSKAGWVVGRVNATVQGMYDRVGRA